MTEVIPKFNLNGIKSIRKRLYSRVFADRVGETLSGAMLTAITRDIRKVITGATRDAAYETVRVYSGEVLTNELCVFLCWQIAGNADKLKQGIPVRVWAAQSMKEWMPIQLTGMQLVRPYKDLMHECTFKILAGSACPATIVRQLSRGSLKHISGIIGFSAPWGNYPYKHAEDMIGLRMLGQFEPGVGRDGKPTFSAVNCQSGMVKWNRDTYLCVRTRKKLQCPQHFEHACAKCAYGTDVCKYAIHPRTYEVGVCEECADHDALFDPASTGVLCVVCSAKAKLENSRRRL